MRAAYKSFRKRDKYVLIGVSLVPFRTFCDRFLCCKLFCAKLWCKIHQLEAESFSFWNIQTERKSLRMTSVNSVSFEKSNPLLNLILKSCSRRFFHLYMKNSARFSGPWKQIFSSKQKFNIFRFSEYQVIRSESHNSFIHRPLAALNLVGDPLE